MIIIVWTLVSDLTKIFKILEIKALSKSEISARLGYRSTPGHVKRAIKKLLDNEFITYTIPEALTSKNQKYKVN